MLEEICALRKEWQRSFPKKAPGGVSALAGFDFQLGVFLLNLLQKWAVARRNQEPIPSPNSFLESISDIMDLPADGLIYVTQVKLTPSTKYSSIFDEFWNTFLLAKRITPDIAPRIRFVLNTSIGPLPDFQKSFRSWAWREGKPELFARELSQHLVARVISQPHDRILGILANELRDTKPVDHLFQWLGRLLAASSKADFDSATKIIWEQLVEISNKDDFRNPPVYVWQHEDRPPVQINAGNVLTGEQPRPSHLRNGYFAPRPDVYNDLTESFVQWWQLSSQDADNAQRLPIFWIGGRSGSGKGVALLHLLAQLHSMGNAHILWLGHHVNYLPMVMHWAFGLKEQGRNVIIAADDPFVPNTQNDAQIWQNALASLEVVRCKGNADGIPAILCCGPTEHAKRLQQAYPDDVDVKIEPLRMEQQSDYEDLRQWYRQRTGCNPPDVGEDNVLLVQLFFQWRTNTTLTNFANNFQKRIRGADATGILLTKLSHVLAANRLYLGYPQAAFEQGLAAAQFDSLDLLKREHHVADMSKGRDGVWLAHPHLANTIYEVWYPIDSSSHAREEHLKDLVCDALEYCAKPREKTAPLWAISRSAGNLIGEEPLVGRIDIRLTSRLMPKIYGQRLQALDGDLPLSELPVWIQLKSVFSEVCLNPDPFELALDKIASDNLADIGLRLTCHKLLEFRDRMSSNQAAWLTEKIGNLLAETVFTWHEWPHVAVDAYKRTGDSAIETLLSEWLARNAAKPIAHRMLFELLHANHESVLLHDVGATLLQYSDDSTSWADIAKQILICGVSSNAVTNACKWAASHCEEWRTGFLLAELVRRQHPDGISLALKWAELWHKEPSANWVLEALCEEKASDPRVRDLSIVWLNQDLPQTNTGFLVEKLIRAFPDDPIVQDFIMQWLQQQTSTANATWLFVWNAAFKPLSNNSRFIELGIEALERVWPGHSRWRFSWKRLWQASQQSQRLQVIGCNWLRHVPKSKPSWLSLWNMFWRAAEGSDELFEIGLLWLGGNIRFRKWGILWGRFWEFRKGDERLVSLAQHWQDVNIRQWNVWAAIWLQIWEQNRTDENCYRLARRWLTIAPINLHSWCNIWDIAWRYDGADEILREAGMKWLRGTKRDHKSWQMVWAYLWKDQPGEMQLREMGYEWIETIPLSHGSWPKMWKDLWPYDKSNAVLKRIGMIWLAKEINFTHGDWFHNWKELARVPELKENLQNLGEKWLRYTEARNNNWVDVWMELAKSKQLSPELITYAKKWLNHEKPNRCKWANLWIRIREERADTYSLRQKVLSYITENFTDSEWSRLWVSLRGKEGENGKLDYLGMKWLTKMLRERPGTQNWHQVWTTLWEAGYEQNKLFAMAERWLQSVAAEDTTWHKVWLVVYGKQPGNTSVAQLGNDWLNKANPRHQGWHQVWQMLYQQNRRDSELLRLAKKWIGGTSMQHLSWGDVWLELYQYSEDKVDLKALALSWLAHTASIQKSPSWSAVWRIFWDQDKVHESLRVIGIEWLTACPNSEVWGVVFDPIRDSGYSPEILQELSDRRNSVYSSDNNVAITYQAAEEFKKNAEKAGYQK